MKRILLLSIVFLATIMLIQGKSYAQVSVNESLGYQKGIMSSRNLYTIFETKLKDVRGSTSGIQTNIALSKNRFLFPKFLENVQGSKLGVVASQELSENEEEIVTIVGKEIIFIREVYYALTTNILEYLNKYPDRENALENHLHYLKILADLQNERLTRLEKRTEELEALVKNEEEKIMQLEKDFFLNFEKFKAKNSEESIQSFIDISQKQITVKAYLAALNKAKQYHAAFLPKLISRIKAIEVNKEALLSGIRVTEIEDVDLGLIIK